MGVYRSAVVLLCCAQAAADDANETECRSLGFGPSLLCTSCHKLGEFVGESDPLVGECAGCCKEESDHASVVYASAVLDVCRWRIAQYPAIQEFAESKLQDYPNVQVTYTQGAPPNMFMKDADGNTVEEIGIANWKVEHIEEFRAPAPRT
jgi:hypothetical protein